MTDLAQRRRQLEDRLQALDERLHEIEDELDSHQSKDWEELATEREGDEVLERLGVSGQEEIARIRAALKRMDEGEVRLLHEMRKRDLGGAARPSALDPVLQDVRHLTGGS
jgi:RNA polymerase-binding transcription factor DksA